MPTDKISKRWLEGATEWAPEDDWDPHAYCEWLHRLAEAKNGLATKCRDIDWALIQEVKALCDKHKSGYKSGTKDVHVTDAGKILVRYISAYNWYTRASFEQVEDNRKVHRTLMHLGDLGTAMKQYDVARMLDKAANKVHMDKAVKEIFAEFMKDAEAGLPVCLDWRMKLNPHDSTSNAFFETLIDKRQENGSLPKVSELGPIIEQLIKDRPNAFAKWMVTDIPKVIESDKRLELLVRLRTDAGLPNLAENFEKSYICLKPLVGSPELGFLLQKAGRLEKESLSWEQVVGPAVTAIQNMGLQSKGCSAEVLAGIAKEYMRPVL
ncbi:uncharacterized protein DSM5745_08779 [Aspergillus mulundensis]|uniref:Uncharacterized protein n=1 Tax=Aspergillus mulundensis TaxID=1810919 RepID=A0A3D8R4S0_9EURO|nr:hypothetical protein DSM5745_08779 [Aspergillus mulundensis]RDW69019.1 hypothetical protein DSM5745_08779 [Aspergillus mulundensis]